MQHQNKIFNLSLAVEILLIASEILNRFEFIWDIDLASILDELVTEVCSSYRVFTYDKKVRHSEDQINK